MKVPDSLYRSARPARVWWNVTKTLVEIAFLWFVLLIGLPIAISIVEVELAFQRFPGYPTIAAAGLAFFALLGIWAAVSLAIEGRGTPLAVDEARRLVVTGPYAYVRNPLAISLVGQGVAIGVAFGSLPVLIYVAIVATWIYYSVRPREERHLQERFGKAWSEYQKHVRAFRPRLTAYRPGQS
jgi:protein-S-isoprenylcysteine O-methyltransferase Ste14